MGLKGRIWVLLFVLFLLLIFLLVPNGFFYESDFGVAISGRAVDVPMDLLKGFFSNFQKEKTNLIQLEDNFVPQNENALCIYNSNSQLSTDICNYYLEKRPGVSLLGLDIPNNSFSNPATKQDMGRANFETYINGPLKSWINNNPDKFITHLAVAKDVPYKVDHRSAAGYLATDGKTINSTLRNTYFYTDNYDLKHFDPREHSNVKFAISFLQGYNLEDIKAMLDKSMMPASAVENQKWVVDADTDSVLITFDGPANLICGETYLIEGKEYKNAPFQGGTDYSCGSIIPGGWGGGFPYFIPGASNEYFQSTDLNYNQALPSSGTLVRKNAILGTEDIILVLNIIKNNETFYKDGVYTNGVNDFSVLNNLVLQNSSLSTIFSRLGVHSSSLIGSLTSSGTLLKKSGQGPEMINYSSYFKINNNLTYTSYAEKRWSIADNEPGIFRNLLINSKVNDSNIFLETSNFKYNLSGDVIYYYGSGSYHRGYPWRSNLGCNYGYGCWITTPGLFDFNVSNRAIMSSMESWNAENFFGNSNHTGMTGASPGQGKIIDSFAPNAFGGTNYSRSFSGALGYVDEPYANPLSHNWAYLYSSGLTLGEVYLAGNPYLYDTNPVLSQGAPIACLTGVIAVGDPLMRLSDEPITKKGVGASCLLDSECLAGKCVADLNGDKFCFNSFGEKCLLSICGKSNATGFTFSSKCSDFNYYSEYSGIKDKIFTIDKGNSKCLDYSTIAFCDGSNWIYSLCDSGSCGSSNEIYSNNSCNSKSLIGRSCQDDNFCASYSAGYLSYCDLDLQGINRCHFDKNACIVDSTGETIPAGHSYCLDSKRKISCENATWKEISICEDDCSEGFCTFNNSEEFVFEELLPGETAYYSIPLIPEKNTINSFFGEDYKFGDYLALYNGYLPPMGFRKVGGVHGISPESLESWWIDKIIGGGTGSFIPSRASISEATLEIGDAFIITKGNSISNLTLRGIKPDYKQTIEIGEGGRFISVWACSEEYTAGRFLNEINLLGANCSTLFHMGKNGTSYNLFDESFQTSFYFKKGQAYYLRCGEMQTINWTPSCCEYSNLNDGKICGINKQCSSGSCKKIGKVINQTLNNTSLAIDSQNYSNQNLSGEKKVELNFKGNKLLEFMHDFSYIDLDLSDLSIDENLSGLNKTYAIIKNLNVSSKTIFIEKQQNTSNAVCIADRAIIENITDLISNCSILSCPGSLGDYNCSIEDEYFVVSGLKHSGIIEYELYCGDNYCNNDENCSTCSSDCGACSPVNPENNSSGGSGSGETGGSGGGGSGSGRGVSKCLTNWTCTQWENCINSKQIRSCARIDSACDTSSPAIIERNCEVGVIGVLDMSNREDKILKNNFNVLIGVIIFIFAIALIFLIVKLISYLSKRFE